MRGGIWKHISEEKRASFDKEFADYRASMRTSPPNQAIMTTGPTTTGSSLAEESSGLVSGTNKSSSNACNCCVIL